MKAAITTTLVAALALAGCGGNDDATPTRDEPVTLKLGGIAIPHFAPIVVGQEKGFFEREGIKLDIQYAEGGAAIVPAVVSGDFDLGYGNAVSAMLARGKGLPLKLIASADRTEARAGPDGSGGLVFVKKDSPFRRLPDLEGHTVAVNTLENSQTLMTKAATDKLGGDHSKLKLVEIPFPEMLSALDAGQVDAVVHVEPFWTQARATGDYRFITAVSPVVEPRMPADWFFVTERYRAEHSDELERFERGLRRSLAYAHDHPEEMRRAVPTFTKVSPEVAAKMNMPTWSRGEVDRAGLQRIMDIMVQYGMLEKPIPLDDLL